MPVDPTPSPERRAARGDGPTQVVAQSNAISAATPLWFNDAPRVLVEEVGTPIVYEFQGRFARAIVKEIVGETCILHESFPAITLPQHRAKFDLDTRLGFMAAVNYGIRQRGRGAFHAAVKRVGVQRPQRPTGRPVGRQKVSLTALLRCMSGEVEATEVDRITLARALTEVVR